jgi:hypothetical protein
VKSCEENIETNKKGREKSQKAVKGIKIFAFLVIFTSAKQKRHVETFFIGVWHDVSKRVEDGRRPPAVRTGHP